jgi:hypothetical protein
MDLTQWYYVTNWFHQTKGQLYHWTYLRLIHSEDNVWVDNLDVTTTTQVPLHYKYYGMYIDIIKNLAEWFMLWLCAFRLDFWSEGWLSSLRFLTIILFPAKCWYHTLKLDTTAPTQALI